MSWLTVKLLGYVTGALLLLCLYLGVALKLSRAEIASMEADHLRAVASAQAEQRRAELSRDNLLAAIADAATDRARKASQEVQAESGKAQERIRTVIKEVPADCPVEMPGTAQDELKRAVDYANEANG